MFVLFLFLALSMGQSKQQSKPQPTPSTVIGQNVVHTHQMWLSYCNPPGGNPCSVTFAEAKKNTKKVVPK